MKLLDELINFVGNIIKAGSHLILCQKVLLLYF